jgi:hypothetical protein
MVKTESRLPKVAMALAELDYHALSKDTLDI